jgi:RNA polymerase sigma factor (sigma-70 family)
VTGDTGRVEEVAAEAFWRLYRKPPPVKTNLEGWLYRTGVRLAFDHLKMERRRARYEALASVFGITRSPQEAAEHNDERRRVMQTVAALKPEQATLILLRCEGLSYAELANAMVRTAKSSGSPCYGTFRTESIY